MTFNTTIAREQLAISNGYHDNIRKRILITTTRQMCMEQCLNEEDFHCRYLNIPENINFLRFIHVRYRL